MKKIYKYKSFYFLLLIIIIAITSIVVYKYVPLSFQINFDRFIIDSQLVEDKDIEVKGLEIKENPLTYKEIEKYQKIIDSIYIATANENYYYKNIGKNKELHENIKPYLDDDYYENIINNKTKSVFKDSIDEIYDIDENAKFKESNIISIEKTMDNVKCVVEVVAINDEVEFHIQKLEFIFEGNIIKEINFINSIDKESNTTNKLNENSLIPSDVEAEYKAATKELFTSMKNINLYNELKDVTNQEANLKLNYLIESLNIKYKNNDSLKDLFIFGKGSFSNYSLQSYKYSDIEGEPITEYTIAISNKDEIRNYKITIDRTDKAILNVVKL